MIHCIITHVYGHQKVPGAQSPEMHTGFLQHAEVRLALVSIMGAGRKRATRPADAPRRRRAERGIIKSLYNNSRYSVLSFNTPSLRSCFSPTHHHLEGTHRHGSLGFRKAPAGCSGKRRCVQLKRRRRYFLPHHGSANQFPPLGPTFPVRTPSKRRARTPQILREDVQSTVPVPRQLRSRGKGITSIVEEPQQENEHPGIKNTPVVEIRCSKHTVQVTPAVSPKKAGLQSVKAPAAENGMLLLLLATKSIAPKHKLTNLQQMRMQTQLSSRLLPRPGTGMFSTLHLLLQDTEYKLVQSP